jgi:hypothetical protein
LAYHYTLTVPAGTPENTPVEKKLQLSYGVITEIFVLCPTGCKQLVKVRLYHQEHQVFPNNSDEPARGNGIPEGGEVHYQLYEAPFALKALGYAPTTIYNHDVTILVTVLPPEVAEPWTVQTSILDKLKSLFGLS